MYKRQCSCFADVCQLPAPKDIGDEELLKLLEAEDPSGFRIPMSLGEPHAELDKGTARQIDGSNKSPLLLLLSSSS